MGKRWPAKHMRLPSQTANACARREEEHCLEYLPVWRHPPNAANIGVVADLPYATADPVGALEALVPKVTLVLEPHGFVAEAAGRGWAHWVPAADSSIVIRAYAFRADGGGISFSMTGASMAPDVEQDLRRLLHAAHEI